VMFFFQDGSGSAGGKALRIAAHKPLSMQSGNSSIKFHNLRCDDLLWFQPENTICINLQ